MEDVIILAMRTAKAASMAYLYAKGRDGVLIDAGLGCHELWEEAGRRGIRIHAVLLTHSHYDHICGLPELLSRTEGLPVYVSTGYPNVSEPLQLRELALRYPGVTFLATHGGQLDISGLSFDDAVQTAASCPNVKFDLSGVYRRDFIELLIQSAGPENVLFASCYPYMDFSLEIARIAAAEIPDSDKERLFFRNAEALLAGR